VTSPIEDYTDRKQVIRHARYCLQYAIESAGLLEVDDNLVKQWRAHLTRLVDVDDVDRLTLNERRRYERVAPEFLAYEGAGRPVEGERMKAIEPGPESHEWRYGFAQFPWRLMIALRSGAYDPDRDLDSVKAYIRRWRYPNGYIGAMSTDIQSFMGAYGETGGILAPIQEMLMQSWEGVIRLFPAWPVRVDASFTTFRAEGAFLVSASLKGGVIKGVSIFSEAGGPCSIVSPWGRPPLVREDKGASVDVSVSGEAAVFDTRAGSYYRLEG